MKKWVFLFIAAVAIGCAASKEVAITEADLSLAKTEFSNVTLAELQTGHAVTEGDKGPNEYGEDPK